MDFGKKVAIIFLLLLAFCVEPSHGAPVTGKNPELTTIPPTQGYDIDDDDGFTPREELQPEKPDDYDVYDDYVTGKNPELTTLPPTQGYDIDDDNGFTPREELQPAKSDDYDDYDDYDNYVTGKNPELTTIPPTQGYDIDNDDGFTTWEELQPAKPDDYDDYGDYGDYGDYVNGKNPELTTIPPTQGYDIDNDDGFTTWEELQPAKPDDYDIYDDYDDYDDYGDYVTGKNPELTTIPPTQGYDLYDHDGFTPWEELQPAKPDDYDDYDDYVTTPADRGDGNRIAKLQETRFLSQIKTFFSEGSQPTNNPNFQMFVPQLITGTPGKMAKPEKTAKPVTTTTDVIKRAVESMEEGLSETMTSDNVLILVVFGSLSMVIVVLLVILICCLRRKRVTDVEMKEDFYSEASLPDLDDASQGSSHSLTG